MKNDKTKLYLFLVEDPKAFAREYNRNLPDKETIKRAHLAGKLFDLSVKTVLQHKKQLKTCAQGVCRNPRSGD